MSCYHPFVGFPDRESGLTENGKYRYKIASAYDPLVKSLDPGAILIPCGKCIGCRLDYSRSWADRMILELQHTGKGIFVTLTYNNDHVPFAVDFETGEINGLSLDKRDWQLFMKRLRSRHEFEDRELRFYACGEYGKTTHRPHMHAVIFGLSVDDFPDRKVKGCNELGQMYYISDFLTDIWSNGFTMLCEVSYNTCAYVSRYVMKKAFAGDPFISGDAVPEFSLMSRRPGLGAYYLAEHPDCLDYSKLHFEGGVEVRLPKYFIKLLEKSDPDRAEVMFQERRKLAEDAVYKKLLNTDLDYCRQLEVEENRLLDRTDILTRLRA